MTAKRISKLPRFGRLYDEPKRCVWKQKPVLCINKWSSKKKFNDTLELSRRRRLKKLFCNGKQRQSSISEQVIKTFDHYQKHENSTSKMPDLLEKLRYGKHFLTNDMKRALRR